VGRGDRRAAEVDLDQPLFQRPYILLGRPTSKKGDTAAAEGMLRQAVQYDPNNKAAHYLLGQLLQQTGRPDEARKELETAERLPGAGER
jgi:Flp pilus assembly protein TadD